MKMKSFFLPALALALFAACSGEEALTSENKVQQTTQNDAVSFDAYLNRTVTRAGAPGPMTTSDNTYNLQSEGFGVFAYYSDGELYSENAIPDFMYNQHVEYKNSAWVYSPLKYWPNEFGSSAVSTGVDRVTFFAYAPYVSVDPTTGQLTGHYTNASGSPELSTETGITALTRNGKTGDPYVRYVGAFDPANCVDLLYGVAAEDFKSYVGALDGANNIKAGDPFINVAKPEIGAKLKFNFKHALAKLTVKVDADVDIVNHDEGDALDDNTRIWIRSITFDGIAPRGYLNLNNGMWYEVMSGNKISHSSVTVYDGRRDGAESIAEDEYETPIGINPKLIQSDTYKVTLSEDPTTKVPTYVLGAPNMTTTPGVTIDSKDLFGDANHDLLVIPANEQVKVTIVYDVETVDATLPNYLSDGVTKGSTVQNRITKAITLGGSPLKLDAGKAYTLNLHLGMTSVKFDAQVSNWDGGGTADNTWLPENAKVIAANSPATNLSVPAEGGTYTYKITGLTASSNKEITPDPAPTDWTIDWAPDDPAGSGILTITVPANTTVSDKTQDVTLTEDVPSTTTKITITQPAAPLGLGVSAVDGTAKTITLSKNASLTDAWSAIITDATDPDNILVKKGTTPLTGVSTSVPATGEFTFNDGVITLHDDQAPAAGDVYTITVKAGDAEAETFTVNIGAISYAPGIVSKAKGDANFTNPLTQTGTGTVTYEVTTSGGPTIDDNGEVTIGSSNGAYTVKATVDNDLANGWYYLTTEATYTLAIGDVVFTAGGSADWNVDAAGGTPSLVICGLTPSDDVSVEEPLVGEPDPDNIASSETINDGVSGSTANKADAKGIAHVTVTIANNSEARTKQAILTVKNGTTEEMTITIKQASN